MSALTALQILQVLTLALVAGLGVACVIALLFICFGVGMHDNPHEWNDRS